MGDGSGGAREGVGSRGVKIVEQGRVMERRRRRNNSDLGEIVRVSDAWHLF